MNICGKEGVLLNGDVSPAKSLMDDANYRRLLEGLTKERGSICSTSVLHSFIDVK